MDGSLHLQAADLAGTDDAQKLAILQCLLLAINADGQITAEEVKRFDAIVGALPWEMDPQVLVALIQGAQQGMTRLSNAKAIMDFVAGLANRLTSPTLREKILYSMALINASDGTMHQFEKNLLGLFVVSFNITSERVAAIKEAVAAAVAPDTAN